MVRVLIPLLVAALIVVAITVMRRGGLVRGVADEMLVSPARPAVAVRVSPPLRLTDARRAEVTPEAPGGPFHGVGSEVWYALYEAAEQDQGLREADPIGGMRGPSRVVSLLAMVDTPYRWPADPEPDQAVLRRSRETKDGRAMFTATFVLPPDADPWSAGEEEDEPWRDGSLVRRFTCLLFQQRAKLIVEYREPCPQGADPSGLPLSDNTAALHAFERRAAAAFYLLDKDLPRPGTPLPYPPADVSRKRLAGYIGEVWRTDGR